MSRIFISYRRNDTAPYAGRLYDRLSTHFGADQVFMDIDKMRPGRDFVDALEQAIKSCDVVLALIGKQWLSMATADGQRRLEQPNDFVRLEIAAALDRKIVIIPLLVQGASMPSPEDLPDSLVKLTRRQAFELRDGRWHQDVTELIKVLEEELSPSNTAATPAAPKPASLPEQADAPQQPRAQASGVAKRMAFLLGIPLMTFALAFASYQYGLMTNVNGLMTNVIPSSSPAASLPAATAEATVTSAPMAATLVSSGLQKIAFVSNRDGTSDIYVMNADGSDPQRLTDNPSNDSGPRWSPDGRQIVFRSERDGNSEIYVMNADGSDPRRLTTNTADDYNPVWSPDGRQIVFRSERDGNSEIYVMNADGSDPRRLTTDPAYDFGPAWLPDSNQIVFASERDGNREIYVMNADGSDPKRLTTNPAQDYTPDWSPDGQHIAFVSERDGNREIYVMNADGSDPRNLTNNIASDHLPAWSSDGKQLAFVSERNGKSEIYIMNADGSNLARLTTNNADDHSPAWWSAKKF